MAYNEEQRIRKLLDIYFEGETTLAQEEELRRFFVGEDIPADLAYAKGIFGAFSLFAATECPPEVTVAIEEAAGPPASRKSRRILPRVYRYLSLAAAVTVAALLALKLIPAKPTVYCYLNGEPVTDINVAERQADMAVRLLEGSAKASADGLSTVKQQTKGPVEKLERAMQFVSAVAGTDSDE